MRSPEPQRRPHPRHRRRKLKAMGMLAGAADLGAIWLGGSGFLETKYRAEDPQGRLAVDHRGGARLKAKAALAGRKGVLSGEQKAWARLCAAGGHRCAVYWSVE